MRNASVERGTRTRIAWRITLLWLAAVAISFLLDQPIASRVYSSGLHVDLYISPVAHLVKVAGTYYFTLAAAAILLVLHRSHVRTALLLCSSGLIAGLFYQSAKWIVGRQRPIFDHRVFNTRPFHLEFFRGGVHGMIVSQADLSFPSGHACIAFATATALTLCLPRWAPIFFLVALAVAAERVLEGVHYLSDVVAGAGFGVLAALLTACILRSLSLPVTNSE
jgi:membrane-associated phospholipid phosphatase